MAQGIVCRAKPQKLRRYNPTDTADPPPLCYPFIIQEIIFFWRTIPAKNNTTRARIARPTLNSGIENKGAALSSCPKGRMGGRKAGPSDTHFSFLTLIVSGAFALPISHF